MSEYQPFEEYYQGWSLGLNVVLLRRDHNGKIVRDIQPFEWYFYAKSEQCAKLTDARIEAVVKRGLFNKVERGERHWKFYVNNPQLSVDPNRVFKRMDNPDLYDIWHRPFTTPEKTPAFRYPEYRDRWREIHEAIYWLESQGIVPLEADVTPLRRFLIDNDVKIQENYRVAYFDLETDDRGKLSEKESQRILSVAWEGDRYDDDPDDCGFLLLEEMSDWGEKKMLSEFVRQMKRYDVLVAWNGNGFDFPMVIARARAVGVRVNWRLWHFADPLPVFRKRFLRQQVGSYALDSMGKQVLGERKLDWREEFRHRHPGVPQTMYELWLRDIDLLEEYNRRDVSILHRLEEATNFLSVERLQNRVAGIFANDFTVSNKIDTMILRKGQREDVHFRTRVWSPGTGEKYVGAHVFDPDVGLHSNVAVFDFKALYPSMIRSFNISPETYIRPEERERWLEESPELVCTCPLVTTEDGIERGGATYRIDSEGFVGQMFKDTTDRRNKYKMLAEERVAEVGTEDDDKYKLYDNLAYAFKSLGLSFYGEMGHASGRYYEVEMAESITLGGQYFIRETQRMASELGYRVIYGDSITARRSVVVRDDRGRVRCLPVERLWEDFGSTSRVRPDGKEEILLSTGYAALTPISTNDSGWRCLRSLVRHRVEKPCFRYTSPVGQVEVTEDHGVTRLNGGALEDVAINRLHEDGSKLHRVGWSGDGINELSHVELYDEVGHFERIKRAGRAGKKVFVGLSVDSDNGLFMTYSAPMGNRSYHLRMVNFYEVGSRDLDDLLFMLGLFCAEGSVSIDGDRYHGASLTMTLDEDSVREFSDAYGRLFTGVLSDGLTEGGVKFQMRSELPSLIFGRLCGVGSEGKRVPEFVFSLPERERGLFLESYLKGDGHSWKVVRGKEVTCDFEDCEYWSCDSKSLDLASGIFVLASSLGYHLSVKHRVKGGSEIWTVKTTKGSEIGRWKGRPKLEEIEAGEFVYDLEVPETQHFVEALGMVSLHNTDSVFIQLMTDEESAGLTDDERRAELLICGEKLRSHCQNQYEELLLACNSPKEWHCVQLEFEDAYDKIAFFAKKRYSGRQILSKGKPAGGIKVKGLEYMRSDYTTLTRKLQYSVLEAVLKDSKDAVQIATELIEPALRMCESGKLPFEDIVISKAVTKDPSDYVTKPLHVRLAAELKRTTADFYPGIKIRYIVMKHKPTIDGCFEHDFDPKKHKYDVSYYWDNIIYPATLRVLQVLFPAKEWRDYLFSHKMKREKLLARYSKWLGDRKRRADAIKRIRENASNILTDLDIATLRGVLNDTEEDIKQQVKRHKRREAKKAEKEAEGVRR